MPIYLTLIMIVWMLTGMLIFNEIKYYSKAQLWIICVAILICCIGIKCLASKKKEQKVETSYDAADTEASERHISRGGKGFETTQDSYLKPKSSVN